MTTSTPNRDLRALALVCSLQPSPAPSSSALMARQILDELSRSHGITGESVRVVDHDVKPGIEADMGDGDAWPEIRQRMLAADILVLATPTWVGHPSSLAQRVFERLNAEMSATDDSGRKLVSGKVAIAAVVGNEDGAHKIVADTFQALNDIGFTIAANGSVYWNANIEQPSEYQDLDKVPDAVGSMIQTAAANSAHLASALAERAYPPPS